MRVKMVNTSANNWSLALDATVLNCGEGLGGANVEGGCLILGLERLAFP